MIWTNRPLDTWYFYLMHISLHFHHFDGINITVSISCCEVKWQKVSEIGIHYYCYYNSFTAPWTVSGLPE